MRVGDLSGRTGVGTHQLRAWERRYGLLQPRRSAGNYRLYSPADEARVRLMQRYMAQGLPAAQAAELTIAARFAVSVGGGREVPLRDVSAAQEEIRRALARFDETSAQRTLERLFVAFTPTTVTRDVLLPYMHELGEQWNAGRITIAQEHFATNFFQARLLALARGWDRGSWPARFVGVCAQRSARPRVDRVRDCAARAGLAYHLPWCRHSDRDACRGRRDNSPGANRYGGNDASAATPARKAIAQFH